MLELTWMYSVCSTSTIQKTGPKFSNLEDPPCGEVLQEACDYASPSNLHDHVNV